MLRIKNDNHSNRDDKRDLIHGNVIVRVHSERRTVLSGW